MAFSVAFPLFLSKASDQKLLGQIHLEELDVNKVNHPPGHETTNYSVIDKLRLLYDMRGNSKDVVVVQNTQLSVTDQEKIQTAYNTELSKLKDENLLPDIKADLNDRAEISSFTCSSTSRPDLSVSFYIVKLYSLHYQITFTMDADTNKIYELDINSTVSSLVLDFDNAYLHWQDYIGLSHMKQDNIPKAALNDSYSNNNSEFLPLYGVPQGAEKPPANDDNRLAVAEATEHDYTDGNKVVTYSFFVANENKSFTITWFFR